MNWFTAKQTKIPLGQMTVAELIAVLQTCPQDSRVCNADDGDLSEINVVNDGHESLVSIY